MSGTAGRGLGKGKGCKGLRKTGSSIGASRATMRSSSAAAAAAAAAVANIPPIATGRGRLGRHPTAASAAASATHAAETQQQQRVADIFLQPGRSRPIREKDADSVVQLMVDEQPAISSAPKTSTLTTTTPVRSRHPAGPGEEEEEASSPAQVGNISSLSLSSYFTPGTVRALTAVVGDLGEEEEEMLMGTLGEEALDSQTVVTVKQPIHAAEEEVGGSSSQQDMFEEVEDDDDRGKDSDWVMPPPENVSSSEEEDDASAGLARRISIADIASRSRGRPTQPVGVSASASTTTTTSRTKQPPPQPPQ